jgi:signal peptidase I
MSKSILRTVSSASFLVLVVLAWWMLAPPQLGGRTSYAVIYGISMEPRFHHGDLVLLRQQPDYHVGEIVGYHSERLGKPVMHRIVKIHDGRYWFKGDNNDFLDPEHPLASQLFGREWVRLPGFGTALETLHTPRNAALLGGLAALFVLLGGGARARRRRRRPVRAAQHPGGAVAAAAVPTASALAVTAPPAATVQQPQRSEPAPGPAASRPPSSRRAPLVPVSAAIIALGLAGVAAMSIVGIVAYTRPPTRVVTQTDLFVQHGTFGYSAHAPVGAVYDHSNLRPGDALFPNLVHTFDVGFKYAFQTFERAHVSGKTQLVAKLTDGRGWTRRFSLAPPRRFSGARTAVHGAVDLDRVMTLVRGFEKATGEHSTEYELLVTPRVDTQGFVGDESIDEHFMPTLTFDLTDTRLRLATTADGASDNGLQRTRSGTGTTKREQKLGSLGVSTARRAALIGLPTSIFIALLGGFLFLVTRGNDEVASIRRRYGAWLIDVAASHRAPELERRVESIDALARIAERYERVILHEQRDRQHSFLVEDDGLVYRYDATEKTPWRFERGHAGAEAVSEDADAAQTQGGPVASRGPE